MGTEIVRATRVLEYVGSRRWVNDSLDRREVKESRVFPNGQIREVVLSMDPEPIGLGLDYTEGYLLLQQIFAEGSLNQGDPGHRADAFWKQLIDRGVVLVKHG